MNPLAYITPISGVVVTIVGVAAFSWVKVLKESNKLLRDNNADLKARNAQLETEIKDLMAKYVESEKSIANLQGKIETLTVIPLNDIKETLVKMQRDSKSSADSNKKVLAVLSKSALIAAEDRSDLLNPSQNVAEQHVVHQTIENKENKE